MGYILRSEKKEKEKTDIRNTKKQKKYRNDIASCYLLFVVD